MREKKGKIVKCVNCGKETYVILSRLERSKNHFCSHRCFGLYNRGKLRVENPKSIYRTTGRMENGKRRSRLYHRVIMEEFLGRPLLRSEVIHHINGNTHDNRIENLMLTTQKEHNRIHKEKLPKTKICKVCGKEFVPPISHRGRNTICSKECWKKYHKIVAKNFSKQVDQFDKNGNFIKTWESFHEISRFFGKDATCVCACCRGRVKSLWGYVWRYHEERN